MIRYPMNFDSQAKLEPAQGGAWLVQSGMHSLSCAVPPEFQGPGGGFSPEDLFAQALLNCFVATFRVYADNSKLSFKELTGSIRLVVDLDDTSRKPVMKSAQIRAQIRGASDADRARLLAQKAFQSGFILNSVKTAVSFELVLE